MTLQDELRLRAGHISHAELLRLMGYARPDGKNMLRLQRVLDDPQLGLGNAAFDFKFSGEQFVKKLSQVLGVAQADVDPQVGAIRQWLHEERMAFKPYLFVDTGFRRTTQPIFALAVCEGMRRIGFPDQFWRKPLAEQVMLAQQLVREHMQDTGGQVGIWGIAKQYWFYYAPSDRVEIFTTGDIVGEASGLLPAQASFGAGIENILNGNCRIDDAESSTGK